MSVPLFIWHCAGGLPVRGVVRGEAEELEKVGVVGLRRRVGGCVFIHQPTPGLWSVKEAPQKTAAARHSDKTLQIVPLIKNLSCRNTIDSKKGWENRQPERHTPVPLPPPTPPFYTLRHTQTCSLFLTASLGCPNCTQKLCIANINPRMGAVCGETAVCKPHCKWVFSLSPTPSPLCH